MRNVAYEKQKRLLTGKLKPPRANMDPEEGRVSGSLNFSNVRGGRAMGQNFTCIYFE